MDAIRRPGVHGARASSFPGREAAGLADRRCVEVQEVVVIDTHTAEVLGRGGRDDRPHASDAEMAHEEHKTPDGSAANPHERLVWPRMMAAMGIAGLVGVGMGMYIYGGWNAAVVGVTWLALGYAVSWIVVWAAGLARAREEREIEMEIDQRHRQEER